MEQQEIFEQLRSILREVKPQIADQIKCTDHFRGDWGIDSLELVEFVARLEQAFRILIPDTDLEQLVSLQATVAYLRSKMITV